MRAAASARAALVALAALALPPAVSAQAADDLAQGEVRRIDREQSKVTIRHGELKSVEMPPMTMVFKVRDANLLAQVKPGDKVFFKVIKEANGQLVVTEIKPAP